MTILIVSMIYQLYLSDYITIILNYEKTYLPISTV